VSAGGHIQKASTVQWCFNVHLFRLWVWEDPLCREWYC